VLIKTPSEIILIIDKFKIFDYQLKNLLPDKIMEKFVDTTEWPKTASARIARGKYFDESKKAMVFNAVRVINKRKGRYVYDLYLNNSLYQANVNPLFLEFEDQ
jgi:hypothetical protein